VLERETEDGISRAREMLAQENSKESTKESTKKLLVNSLEIENISSFQG
jgi:hypothetical protein